MKKLLSVLLVLALVVTCVCSLEPSKAKAATFSVANPKLATKNCTLSTKTVQRCASVRLLADSLTQEGGSTSFDLRLSKIKSGAYITVTAQEDGFLYLSSRDDNLEARVYTDSKLTTVAPALDCEEGEYTKNYTLRNHGLSDFYPVQIEMRKNDKLYISIDVGVSVKSGVLRAAWVPVGGFISLTKYHMSNYSVLAKVLVGNGKTTISPTVCVDRTYKLLKANEWIQNVDEFRDHQTEGRLFNVLTESTSVSIPVPISGVKRAGSLSSIGSTTTPKYIPIDEELSSGYLYIGCNYQGCADPFYFYDICYFDALAYLDEDYVAQVAVPKPMAMKAKTNIIYGELPLDRADIDARVCAKIGNATYTESKRYNCGYFSEDWEHDAYVIVLKGKLKKGETVKIYYEGHENAAVEYKVE